MPSPEPLHISAFWLVFLLLFLVIFLWILCRYFFSTKRSANSQKTIEPDWSIKTSFLQVRQSYLYDWDIRVKNLSLLMVCFVVALVNNLQLLLVSVVMIGMVLVYAKINIRASLKRIVALVGFLSILFIVLPFTVPHKTGDLLIFFDPIAIIALNVRGVVLALKISLKAIVAAMLIEAMVGTSSFSAVVHGFADVGVPDKICQLMLLTHRYIFVLQQDAKRMFIAMRMRGFRLSANIETFKILANFLGMLFVTSFERTERVLEAMKMRGYEGVLPKNRKSLPKLRDWCLGLLCFLYISVLLVLD